MIFKDAQNFAMYIEKEVLARGKNGEYTHLDAIIAYCENNFIEPSDIKHLIKGPLKEKLEVCYQDLNYLPKTAKLDI